MRIMLAPMDGVTDFHMRKILTRIFAYDRCVTEFVRVTNTLYPHKVFLKSSPELESGGKTESGVPVYMQLLGSDTHAMAVNARRAVELGAPGVDLNFGCPAKTVNRHGGGSALLRTPVKVRDIVAAVRDGVDPSIPVSAKIRLGYNNSDALVDIAAGVEDAGASELCIHARTRVDGYKPPAHWTIVKQVQSELSIPVIINGEIWNASDAVAACSQSGCQDVMLGRGALAMPDLANQVQARASGDKPNRLEWQDILLLLEDLRETAIGLPERYAGNRTKQWLSYLIRQYPGARDLFTNVKRLSEIEVIGEEIKRHRRAVA